MKKNLRFLMLTLLCAVFSVGWAQTTYKLVQVTSVEAGGLYVFEQGGYVMNNTVSSSVLQTTNSYNTTDLAGTETYVWTLESGTVSGKNGYHMKNVSKTSNQYLNNSGSSTNVSFGTKTSVWSFDFKDGVATISNLSNNNRFLGYTSSTSYGYKAYAVNDNNLNNNPHAITVYKLVEEESKPSIATITSISPMSIELNADGSFTCNYQLAEGVSEEQYTVTWESGDNNKLEVTSTGEYTAKALGTAKVTVTITPKEALSGSYSRTSEDFNVTISYPFVHQGTESDPFTVEEAIAWIDANGTSENQMYVRGIVCQFDQINSDGSATYWISDDGTTANKFEIFKGQYLDEEDFTEELLVGDELVVKGILTKYSTTYEFSTGSVIVSRTTKAPVVTLGELDPSVIISGATGQFTLEITPATGLTNSDYTIEWSSDVNGFVNTTGAYDATELATSVVALTVTVTPNNTESYKPVTKEFDIEVLEDGVFDFNKGLSYGSGLTASNSTSYIETEKTWTAGNVVLKTNGKYRYYTANAGKQLRIGYDNSSTMQFAVPEGKAITQIVFNAGKFNLSTETGTLTEKTWTGKSRNVTFSVSNTSEINSITVTYGDDDGKLSPELQIPDVEVVVDNIQDLAYTTNSNGAITFVSEDDDIAEVVEDNGKYVVMAYAEGEVQITATQATTDEYSPAEVTFKVTVRGKQAPGLAISNQTVYVGEEKEFSVTTSSNGAITFTSADDNIAMAEYDAASQTYILYGFSAGTTTITASQAATSIYNSASSTFTVTVSEAPAVVKYQKVTSTSDLTSGRYLIVYETGNKAFNGSLSTLDESANFKVVTISNGIIEVEIDKDDFYFNINAVKDGYAIKSASGKYIGRTADSNGFNESATVVYTNTISFNDGNVVITSSGGPNLQFWKDSDSGKFRYYSSTQQPIQLYKLVGKDAKFLPKFKGYTSIYYSDKNLVVPEKVTGLTYYVEDGRGHFNNDYPAGSIIPRNTAVVLEYEDKDNIPEAGVTVTFAETLATGTAPARNMLRGFDTAQTTTVDEGEDAADYYFYRLTVGAVGSGKEGDVGFYWGEEDGAPFLAGAHKVYLAVEKSQFANAIQASSIIIDDSDNISEIAIPEKTIEGVYTLSGRRVYGNNLPKGIYIVNGKKMVIK